MLPKYCLIDDFLEPDLLERLRRHVTACEDSFAPAKVRDSGSSVRIAAARQSSKCALGLGSLKADFADRLEDIAPRLFTELGVPPAPIAEIETELVAHRDGAFFGPHIDTFVAADRTGETTDRLISTVFYFSFADAAFTGGELAIFPFAKGPPPATIQPRHNRLVAFPSFVLHEVRKVSVPGDAFGDARFSINGWLHRQRG